MQYNLSIISVVTSTDVTIEKNNPNIIPELSEVFPMHKSVLFN